MQNFDTFGVTTEKKPFKKKNYRPWDLLGDFGPPEPVLGVNNGTPEKPSEGGMAKEFYFEEGCYIQELHNCETDPAMSIARARVLSGMTTKFHRLQGIAEYYVIISGTGLVEVGDTPPRAVSPMDVVAIPPGYRQRITNTGKDDLIFLCCCTPKFSAERYESLES